MTVKEKQNLLAFLGLYTGAIDGVWGGGSKAAARTFQERNGLAVTGDIDQTTAFLISEAIDAKIEGAFTVTEAEPETGSVWDGIKYFTPDEFACKCNRYCDGFPEQISRNLLVLLDGIREHYGVPVTISSGVRCQTHNANVGGVYNSRHLEGKAADFCVRGKSANTVVSYLQTIPGVRYTYAIDGSWVHVDVD